jgi:hypothetical protein
VRPLGGLVQRAGKVGEGHGQLTPDTYGGEGGIKEGQEGSAGVWATLCEKTLVYGEGGKVV